MTFALTSAWIFVISRIRHKISPTITNSDCNLRQVPMSFESIGMYKKFQELTSTYID